MYAAPRSTSSSSRSKPYMEKSLDKQYMSDNEGLGRFSTSSSGLPIKSVKIIKLNVNRNLGLPSYSLERSSKQSNDICQRSNYLSNITFSKNPSENKLQSNNKYNIMFESLNTEEKAQ
jgi:hypothetical protein